MQSVLHSSRNEVLKNFQKKKLLKTVFFSLRKARKRLKDFSANEDSTLVFKDISYHIYSHERAANINKYILIICIIHVIQTIKLIKKFIDHF